MQNIFKREGLILIVYENTLDNPVKVMMAGTFTDIPLPIYLFAGFWRARSNSITANKETFDLGIQCGVECSMK